MFDPKTRFLILDDMMTMRMHIKKYLGEMGYSDIQEAEDGAQGWEILQSSDPAIEVVISDWSMPNMTGLDLLKKVRADEKYKAIPFIMVTSESEKSQLIEAAKARVTDYVIKPFDEETIKKKLTAVYQKVFG